MLNFIIGCLIGALLMAAFTYLSTHSDFRVALWSKLRAETVELEQKLTIAVARLRERVMPSSQP